MADLEEVRPEDKWTPLPTSAEYAMLLRERLHLRQDRDHWKANHDNLVAENRRLREALVPAEEPAP